MQHSSASRVSHRPAVDQTMPEPPQQSLPGTNISGAPPDTATSRSASNSSKASSTRRQNPTQQLSQIEKSVTHLLVATKQLLETLTQWSRHNASESEVSDVYVRLGYEFNIACRAFNGIGVDTGDLGPVPELLRSILEETLSQEASPASLDKFLPKIRDIIINLLHGLKRKQQRLRAKQAKDGTSSVASAHNLVSNPGDSMIEANRSILPSRESTQPPSQSNSRRSLARSSGGRGEINDTGDHAKAAWNPSVGHMNASMLTERSGESTTVSATYPSAHRRGSLVQVDGQPNNMEFSVNNVSPEFSQHDLNRSSATMVRRASQREPQFPTPPPPPPKQQDALAALQRGGDLERRASRRFSAYQISKHLGASSNGIPMLPPTQNSPIPNRGRDVQDSMNAVRTRGSGAFSGSKGLQRTGEISPQRSVPGISRSRDDGVGLGEDSTKDGTQHYRVDGSVPQREVISRKETLQRNLSAQLPQDLPSTVVSPYVTDKDNQLKTSDEGSQLIPMPERSFIATEQEAQVQSFMPEGSPQPGKELTLFLQYKSKIKKFILPGGSLDLSVPRLQLAFIEKFAWNTHNNGNDLPEIYIQDPVSGVRHELEDLRDVRDRSVLVLNIEALDEVTRHIDDGFIGIKKLLEGVRVAVDSQHHSLQRVSDRQQDTLREVSRRSIRSESMHVEAHAATLTSSATSRSRSGSVHVQSIHSLRAELNTVKETFTKLFSGVKSSMLDVQEKAALVKTLAIEGVVPNLDAAQGRSYVDTGKKTLSDDSEQIVTQVDDLQDTVEDLRKDVVSRGVRPLARQLEAVNKRLSNATTELKRMQAFLRREKPVWTKIWERELAAVCTDRDFLTMQEDLAKDLENDLEQAAETFALVEQATRQQSSSNTSAPPIRNASRQLLSLTGDGIDPVKAKDGVLGEVRALQPNHESRLEAIERAERVRQIDLESRAGGEFTREVSEFVAKGKLKKTATPVAQLDQARRAQDESNMREGWGREKERAAKKAQEREQKKAQQQRVLQERKQAELEQEATAQAPSTHHAPNTALPLPPLPSLPNYSDTSHMNVPPLPDGQGNARSPMTSPEFIDPMLTSVRPQSFENRSVSDGTRIADRPAAPPNGGLVVDPHTGMI